MPNKPDAANPAMALQRMAGLHFSRVVAQWPAAAGFSRLT
jgi:hypothetical protein